MARSKPGGQGGGGGGWLDAINDFVDQMTRRVAQWAAPSSGMPAASPPPPNIPTAQTVPMPSVPMAQAVPAGVPLGAPPIPGIPLPQPTLPPMAQSLNKDEAQELAVRERSLERIRNLQDPTILRETVRLEKEITEATKEREVAKLREQQRDPQALAADVRIDAELGRLRQQSERARAAEVGRQSPLSTLGGAAMDIGSRLPGGGLLSTGAGMFQAATGEGAAGISGALGGLGMGAAAGPIGAVVAALPAAIDGLGKLKDVVIEMGSKASPGALIRWNLAMDDTQATIGRVFVPALETMTDALRLGGDFLTSVLPSAQDMREVFAPLREAILELRPALAEIAPMFKELGKQTLRDVAFALSEIVKTAKPMIEMVVQMYTLGGLLGDGKKDLDSSVGNAPRPAQFTDMAALARSNYASIAMQSGEGGGRDFNAETASNTAKIEAKLVELVTALTVTGINLRKQGNDVATETGIAVANILQWVRGR